MNLNENPALCQYAWLTDSPRDPKKRIRHTCLREVTGGIHPGSHTCSICGVVEGTPE